MSTWEPIEDGGVRREEWFGGERQYCQVVLGGNGLWSAWVERTRRGRTKKKGRGYCAAKTIRFDMMKPQRKIRADALNWAADAWDRLLQPTDPPALYEI